MADSASRPETVVAEAEAAAEALAQVKAEIGRAIFGQERVIELSLAAVLAGGHALLIGAPGLAKTRAIKVLGEGIEGDFHRIQFTPDLLPADLTGTEIYRPQDGSFKFQPGPLFHNLVLADEINRAPAKVQSALLEAMQERRVSIGDTTHDLPAPFLVIATQNPVEQAGTFELPEAQLDRFMLRHRLSYPTPADEAEVVRRSFGLRLKRQGDGAVPMSAFDAIDGSRRMHVADLTTAMAAVQAIHVSDVFVRDVVELVNLTRRHKDIELGCSPRAALALVHASRARAFIHGRNYTIPEDIFALADDVILHRMRLSYEALATGRTAEVVLRELLDTMA